MSRVILNVIATNKYVYFLDGIIESTDSFLFKNSDITVMVHTNMDISAFEKNHSDKRIHILKNQIDHEPWPFTTLKRFHYFLSIKEKILEYDFSFYIDVDSLFSSEISDEILPDKGMVGTIHPCLFDGPGSPERNPASRAYIPWGSNNRYFCGGFFGGDSSSFVNTSEMIKRNIDLDLEDGVVAVWHDESHINRFFFDNPPSVVLDNHFCAAEEQMNLYPDAKVCFLDKSRRGGHDFFRS